MSDSDDLVAENARLASLYVATYQMHASLDPRPVAAQGMRPPDAVALRAGIIGGGATPLAHAALAGLVGVAGGAAE